MSVKDKTKAQLIQEVAALRHQVEALQTRPPAANGVIEPDSASQQLQQEISNRLKTEEFLFSSRQFAQNIIDSSLDMIIAVDTHQHIIEFNRAAQNTFGYTLGEVIGRHVNMLYADPLNSRDIYETTLAQGRCVQEIVNRRKNGESFPSFLSASVLRDAAGNPVGVMGVSRDITHRKQAEEMLHRQNRELLLLYRAAQALNSTLDLDEVLATVLEEVRRLLKVVACSAWLVDRFTGELVCHAVTDPHSHLVHGWRLPAGQGLAGWAVQHGQSLNSTDISTDPRHFKGVDQTTGLPLRSILTVPLRTKQHVIGVIQVVDETVNRFTENDQQMVEALAANAAAAIENARLYEQTRQDAETKDILLQEVNHRVKNNLAAIIGLLYAERFHTHANDTRSYQTIMQDLIGRVQGLATVHSLLSASEWAPLSLANLAGQVIHSSLRSIPTDTMVTVEVRPSPVQVMPRQANNLALIINELVTNSVKYAFAGQTYGQIWVNVTTNAHNNSVILEFRDNGPGYPPEVLQRERHNVGVYLIQMLVRQDLNGELTLLNQNGAVARIEFKSPSGR
jgi:PAS domain S-box-containing protein